MPPMAEVPWTGRLAVVGAGLEGLASMTPRGRRLLEAARLVVAAERHAGLVAPRAAETLVWDGRPERLDQLLAGRDGAATVLLASGDPNLFGIGATLVRRFGPAAIDVEPSVSSLQLALARAGVPMAGAALLSAHGRSLAAAVGAARLQRRAAILTDCRSEPSAVAGALAAAGVEPEARLVVGERLGAPDERVREGSVGAPPPPPYDPLSVVVLDRAAAPGPGVGAPEAAYEHAGEMVTKAEVRAIALAALDLGPDDVLWDVGAGSGSVAIEAGRLAARGAVYAVERRADRRHSLERNLARWGSWNVEVVAGDAVPALAGLPAPDAVFLGGGGPELATLVRLSVEAMRRRRLPIPGRLVVTTATLESTLEALAAGRDLGLEPAVSQVQVSRGRPLAGRLGWEALNPVHVLAARVSRA